MAPEPVLAVVMREAIGITWASTATMMICTLLLRAVAYVGTCCTAGGPAALSDVEGSHWKPTSWSEEWGKRWVMTPVAVTLRDNI